MLVYSKENEQEFFELKHTEYCTESEGTKPKDCFTDWWLAVIPLLEPITIRAQSTHNSELEIRLGKFIMPRITSKTFDRRNRFYSQELTRDFTEFQNGVSKEWFEGHLSRFEKSNHWTNQPKWNRIEEFVYRDQVRMRREPGGYASFIKKSIHIRNFDIPLSGSRSDLRVSLKTETPTQIRCGVPDWIRFKERISFLHKNTFQYDFTIVWEGKTIQEALNSKPCYEIEVECTNLSQNSRYLTESMLLKSKDLLAFPVWNEPKTKRQTERDKIRASSSHKKPRKDLVPIPTQENVVQHSNPQTLVPVLPNNFFPFVLPQISNPFTPPIWGYQNLISPLQLNQCHVQVPNINKTAQMLRGLDELISNIRQETESSQKNKEIKEEKPPLKKIGRNILATVSDISGLKK